MSDVSQKVYYHLSEKYVFQARDRGNLLCCLMTFDRSELWVAPVDDVIDHSTMLEGMGHSDGRDKYFFYWISKDGAIFDAICPSNYRNIKISITRRDQYVWDGLVSLRLSFYILGLPPELPISFLQIDLQRAHGEGTDGIHDKEPLNPDVVK